MKIHLVGGFTGSGKTTAILSACRSLAARKVTAGVITNDQGKYLVDTAFFDWQKIPAVQVTGGCVCCNYDEFLARLDQLDRAVQPEVVFVEADGTCADLVATVLKPLDELRKNSIPKVTLSVFADCRLLTQWLAGEALPFGNPAMYVYGRQLDEAGVILLNKRDLISPDKARLALDMARNGFPGKQVHLHNAFDALNTDKWLEELDGQSRRDSVMNSLLIDYARYAAGESSIGRVDTQLTFSAPSPVDLRSLMVDWIVGVNKEVRSRSIGLGHLKMMIRTGHTHAKIGLTTGDAAAWRAQIPDMHGKELKTLVNTRMEAEPAVIREILVNAAKAAAVNAKCELEEKDTEAYVPAYPKPKRRVP
jgi:G3E family GTPase